MFDERTGHLALVRDQLGIKPLFFVRRGEGVIFASELKAIATTIGPELEMEPGALIASMLYYWIPEQRCALKGVEKLPPGTWVDFSPDGLGIIHRYWQMAEVAAEAAAGPPADLGPVVEESVAAHLVADVPVSTFLSGGLDSSIVTVLAKRRTRRSTPTRSPSALRTSASRRCPTTRRTRGKVAARYGVHLHEIEIAPTSSRCCPALCARSTSPSATRLRSTRSSSATPPGRPGSRCCSRGWVPTSSSAATASTSPASSAPGTGTYRCGPTGVIRPTVDRLPVAFRGRGLRQVRGRNASSRSPTCPEEPAFRRSYTLYARDELEGLLDPTLARHVGELFEEHAAIYNDTTLADHVSRMCLADSRLFLPGLNLAYTDRGRAWPRRPRSAFRSSTSRSSGRPSHSRAPPRWPVGRARLR